jgi:hypothetical protein
VASGRLLPESLAQQRYWLGLRALLPSWQWLWADPQAAPFGQVRCGPGFALLCTARRTLLQLVCLARLG